MSRQAKPESGGVAPGRLGDRVRRCGCGRGCPTCQPRFHAAMDEWRARLDAKYGPRKP